MARVLVLFYSMHGHVYRLADAVAEGARGVEGTTVDLKRVPETIPQAVLDATGATQAQQAFAHVPVAEPAELANYDAILIGTPTRFGNMAGQMRNFWDQTVQLWLSGALIGKVGSAFVATGTQHGGAETTITSIWSTFCHQGMLITGLPYSERRIMEMGEVTGGSPYGAGTMSNVDGSRWPTENELEIGKSQGRYVAELAKRLFG
jgi:NAD(P)H:quinone oxidoreductase type IV